MSDKNQVHSVFDGIEEQDNHLPNWWLGILFGTIVFGFGYWLYYETTQSAPGPAAEYKEQLAEYLKKMAQQPVSDESLLALTTDNNRLAAGQEVFKTNCVSCHGEKGEGKLAPNLTDNYWLHGGKPSEIHKTISGGVKGKGMPAWMRGLGPERIRNVTAYVLTLRGKNLPGKAPQGDLVELTQ